MRILNQTDLTPASSALTGIPGLRTGISGFLCHSAQYMLWLWVASGTFAMRIPCTVVSCITLAILSLTDLSCATTTPKASAFSVHLKEIIFDECLVQIPSSMPSQGWKSGVLMLMALDRYVANSLPSRATNYPHQSYYCKGRACHFPERVACHSLDFHHQKTTLLQRQYHTPYLLWPHGCSQVILWKYQDQCHLWSDGCPPDRGFWHLVHLSLLHNDPLHGGQASPQQKLSKAFSTCTAHICAIVFSYSPAFLCFFPPLWGHRIPPSCHIIAATFICSCLPPWTLSSMEWKPSRYETVS